jgi:hypothetical protein
MSERLKKNRSDTKNNVNLCVKLDSLMSFINRIKRTKRTSRREKNAVLHIAYRTVVINIQELST